MSDYENNGCFCLDELTDGKTGLKRLTDDLNAEYPVFLEKRDADAISELHITVKALQSEFSNLLHSLAEYDSVELYQTALRLFDGIKRFDYLGSGNYPALISALYSFADMLPDKAGIDAKAAAHLMNRIKMGYYPTDEEHVRLIKQAVSFPKTQVNILDPCCGEGLALKTFAENENSETYGIELDESRGHTAQKNLNNARLGSFFHSSVPFGRFHVLFLNPPYISCPGENGGRRMERAFLSDTLPLLIRGGLLVYIIPYHRADESVCRILASNYKNLSVFRFRDGEFKKYRQIVFFGIRSEKRAAERTAKKIERLCLTPENIPLIDTVPKGLYSLPNKETDMPYFKGSVFDVKELEEQLKVGGTDMPEMQSYMGVNEGSDGIIGKLLYYSTANILIPKDKFIELGNAFNLPKVKPARESAASAYRYATTALKDRIAEKNACGTHIYRIYCRDNKQDTSDIICRELVKETLDSTTNNYKKLANIAFKRETEEMYYDNTEYDSQVDVTGYCERALTLYERFKSCYNSDHVDSVVQFLLEKMQAVKINIHDRQARIIRVCICRC